jgi:S1 RNA binding domain protein
MVTVKVINVDKDGKIGLSIRKAVDKPIPERPERPSRPSGGGGGGGFRRNDDRGGDRGFRGGPPKATFDDKLSKFLKDSEERMSSLKKNTESKRGGRGAKRF